MLGQSHVNLYIIHVTRLIHSENDPYPNKIHILVMQTLVPEYFYDIEIV